MPKKNNSKICIYCNSKHYNDKDKNKCRYARKLQSQSQIAHSINSHVQNQSLQLQSQPQFELQNRQFVISERQNFDIQMDQQFINQQSLQNGIFLGNVSSQQQQQRLQQQSIQSSLQTLEWGSVPVQKKPIQKRQRSRRLKQIDQSAIPQQTKRRLKTLIRMKKQIPINTDYIKAFEKVQLNTHTSRIQTRSQGIPHIQFQLQQTKRVRRQLILQGLLKQKNIKDGKPELNQKLQPIMEEVIIRKPLPGEKNFTWLDSDDQDEDQVLANQIKYNQEIQSLTQRNNRLIKMRLVRKLRKQMKNHSLEQKQKVQRGIEQFFSQRNIQQFIQSQLSAKKQITELQKEYKHYKSVFGKGQNKRYCQTSDSVVRRRLQLFCQQYLQKVRFLRRQPRIMQSSDIGLSQLKKLQKIYILLSKKNNLSQLQQLQPQIRQFVTKLFQILYLNAKPYEQIQVDQYNYMTPLNLIRLQIQNTSEINLIRLAKLKVEQMKMKFQQTQQNNKLMRTRQKLTPQRIGVQTIIMFSIFNQFPSSQFQYKQFDHVLDPRYKRVQIENFAKYQDVLTQFNFIYRKDDNDEVQLQERTYWQRNLRKYGLFRSTKCQFLGLSFVDDEGNIQKYQYGYHHLKRTTIGQITILQYILWTHFKGLTHNIIQAFQQFIQFPSFLLICLLIRVQMKLNPELFYLKTRQLLCSKCPVLTTSAQKQLEKLSEQLHKNITLFLEQKGLYHSHSRKYKGLSYQKAITQFQKLKYSFQSMIYQKQKMIKQLENKIEPLKSKLQMDIVRLGYYVQCKQLLIRTPQADKYQQVYDYVEKLRCGLQKVKNRTFIERLMVKCLPSISEVDADIQKIQMKKYQGYFQQQQIKERHRKKIQDDIELMAKQRQKQDAKRTEFLEKQNALQNKQINQIQQQQSDNLPRRRIIQKQEKTKYYRSKNKLQAEKLIRKTHADQKLKIKWGVQTLQQCRIMQQKSRQRLSALEISYNKQVVNRSNWRVNQHPSYRWEQFGVLQSADKYTLKIVCPKTASKKARLFFIDQVWKFLSQKRLTWKNFGWMNIFSSNFKFDIEYNQHLSQIRRLSQKQNMILNKIRSLQYVPPIQYIYRPQFGSGFNACRNVYKGELVAPFTGYVDYIGLAEDAGDVYNRVQYCRSRISENSGNLHYLYSVGTSHNYWSLGPMFNGTHIHKQANLSIAHFYTQFGYQLWLVASKDIVKGDHFIWYYGSQYDKSVQLIDIQDLLDRQKDPDDFRRRINQLKRVQIKKEMKKVNHIQLDLNQLQNFSNQSEQSVQIPQNQMMCQRKSNQENQ